MYELDECRTLRIVYQLFSDWVAARHGQTMSFRTKIERTTLDELIKEVQIKEAQGWEVVHRYKVKTNEDYIEKYTHNKYWITMEKKTKQ